MRSNASWGWGWANEGRCLPWRGRWRRGEGFRTEPSGRSRGSILFLKYKLLTLSTSEVTHTIPVEGEQWGWGGLCINAFFLPKVNIYHSQRFFPIISCHLFLSECTGSLENGTTMRHFQIPWGHGTRCCCPVPPERPASLS